jgi:hypothetical protein
MATTYDYLKQHQLDIFEAGIFGRQDFKDKKLIEISSLYANQSTLDIECLALKVIGKNHTVPFVLNYRGINILIDGHHTVISKKINGKKQIKAKYLQI